MRDAIDSANAAKRRDAFGRINDEFDRAKKASNAALASAKVSRAAPPKPEAGAPRAPVSDKDSLDRTSREGAFAEYVAYHASPNHAPAGLVLGAILLCGVLFLFRREPYEIQDDPNFRAALGVWHKLLGQDADFSVPREVKRFQNRARYYAMRLRPNDAQRRWFDRVVDWLDGVHAHRRPSPQTSIPEECVVALTAIHQVCPELLKDAALFESRPEPQGKCASLADRLVKEHDHVSAASSKP